MFVDAAEEIRRLLHQFAAGFLKSPAPELLERLAQHELSSARRLAAAVAAAEQPVSTGGEMIDVTQDVEPAPVSAPVPLEEPVVSPGVAHGAAAPADGPAPEREQEQGQEQEQAREREREPEVAPVHAEPPLGTDSSFDRG